MTYLWQLLLLLVAFVHLCFKSFFFFFFWVGGGAGIKGVQYIVEEDTQGQREVNN